MLYFGQMVLTLGVVLLAACTSGGAGSERARDFHDEEFCKNVGVRIFQTHREKDDVKASLMREELIDSYRERGVKVVLKNTKSDNVFDVICSSRFIGRYEIEPYESMVYGGEDLGE